MPLSFAGVDLLLDWPDPDVNSPKGTIEQWLDRFAPLEDLRLFGCAPVSYVDGRFAPRNLCKESVTLPMHNWSVPPRLRLNTLYWPATGAVRWAYFVGLVDEARLDRIIANLATSASDVLENKHGTLKISEGESHRKRKIETKMYLLPPRRIAVDGSAGSTKLWLLPLVDERYLWQNTDIGSIGRSIAGEDWEQFFDSLGSEVPFSGDKLDIDNISADYVLPDGTEFARKSANVAITLDAAAESVGMRIVRDFAGKVYLMSAARSATRLQESLGPSGLTEKGYEIIAGGKADKYNALRVPYTVTVLFPLRRVHFASPEGDYYARSALYSDSLAEETLTYQGSKVIYTTAAAEQGIDFGVDNTTAVNTLTARIARDYYAWLTENYDITFAGLKEWKPNGYDDWLVYSYASCCPDRPGEPTLRVMSMPYNFGACQQLQQFEEQYTNQEDFMLREPAGLVRVKITEALPPAVTGGGPGSADVAGELLTSGNNSFNVPVIINLRDALSMFDGEIGDRFWATAPPRDNPAEFEIVAPALRVNNLFTVLSSLAGNLTAPTQLSLSLTEAPFRGDRTDVLASVAGNAITLNRSGWYLLIFFVEVQHSSGGAPPAEIASTYLTTAGTGPSSATFKSYVGPGNATVVGFLMGRFAKNDVITHFASVSANTCTVTAGGIAALKI